MRRKRLWIMSGIPGSGKSTWVRNKVAKSNDTAVWVSRDLIRFNLLEENDDYFAKENLVYDCFIENIKIWLQDDEVIDVFADATHLSVKGRAELISKIAPFENLEINCIYFDIPLEVALERNEQREGLAKVPRGVIRRMYFSQVAPAYEEGFEKIFYINEKGEEKLYGRIEF